MPVTRGIMRNTWFPKKMADYAPASRLEELAKEDIVPERDPTFGSKKERKAAMAAQPPAAPQIEVEVQEEVVERVELPLLSVRHYDNRANGEYIADIACSRWKQQTSFQSSSQPMLISIEHLLHQNRQSTTP